MQDEVFAINLIQYMVSS